MSSQGIMSSKKATNNLDCVLLKDKSLVFQFSSLSLSATKTSPPCQMLVIQPVNYISSYILPRDPQGWLTPNKLLNRTVSCELVGNIISLYPSMSRDPIQPHSVPSIDIIQHLLALSYQWRRFGSTKSFRATWLLEQILTYFPGLTFG